MFNIKLNIILQMTYIISLLITTTLQLLLLNKAEKIANYINLVDKPDRLRKFQKKPTPLIGGLIICLILFLNLFFLRLSSDLFIENIFIYLFPIITLIGLIDDKYDLTANVKILITILFFLIFFYFYEDLIIKELRFSSFAYVQNIFEFMSIPLTILCCLLLTNSINMIDGKNGLCTSTQLIILSFIGFYIMKESYLNYGYINFKDKNLYLIFLYSLLLFIFLYFNLKGLIFLGDAGAFLGSFIIIYLILDVYSNNSPLLKCEQIFFLLILPGIDMLRVFIYRLINKKNPFKGDNEHLHHLLEQKFKSHKKITLILSLGLIIPNLIIIFYSTKMLIFLIIYLLIYSLSIRYLYKIKT